MELVITVLFVFLCIYTLGKYDIKDTTLGNAGLSARPGFTYLFNQARHKGVHYRNSKELDDAIKQYAEKNIEFIKISYRWDIEYSLCQKIFLICTGSQFSKNFGIYHKLPDNALQYYIDQLDSIKGTHVNTKKVYDEISNVIKADLYTHNKIIAHFVMHAHDYLVKDGILQFKQPKSSEEFSDVTNIITNMHENFEHPLLNKPVKVHKINEVLASVSGDVSDRVNANIKNELKTKADNFMSRLRVAEDYKAIAIVGAGLAGLVVTGDASYEIGKASIMNITKDTNDTAQRHGVCIVTITACTVLLALCTTTAYWIVCKQQQQYDIAYTTMGLM